MQDGQPRLWLALADGRVLALRLPQAAYGDDRVIEPLARALCEDVGGHRYWLDALPGVGPVQVLYAAPVLPCLQSVHAGFVLEPDFQVLLAALDAEVMQELLTLEREVAAAACMRAGAEGNERTAVFFASVRNYNRLVALPREQRLRRLQALQRFPALVAPILLTTHRYPNLFDGRRHAWREKDLAVEAAIDQGRDLTGALARHYGVSRGLVRAPLQQTYWQTYNHEERKRILHVLDALPANQRPNRADFERYRSHLLSYFELLGVEEYEAGELPAAVHRGAFRLGWRGTWEAAEQHQPDLARAMRDVRDYLAALRRASQPILKRQRVPGQFRLTAAFLACHGLVGLLKASARWHRLRPAQRSKWGPPDFSLPAVVGFYERQGATARELLTPRALAEEGEAMHHCVADYWERCVDGDRIFALQLGDGERATAQYRPMLSGGVEVEDFSWELVELLGPCNEPVSEAMELWAEELGRELDAPARSEQRRAALRGARLWDEALASWQERLKQQEPKVWLDAKSERQLRQALRWLGEQPPAPEVLLATFVAGYEYHRGPELESAMGGEDVLQLVREPDNPYDRLAVRLDWQGQKIGYLPRAENREIAERLDRGEALQARIRRIDRGAPSWLRVLVQVSSLEPIQLAA